jgi:hypothetical protein
MLLVSPIDMDRPVMMCWAVVRQTDSISSTAAFASVKIDSKIFVDSEALPSSISMLDNERQYLLIHMGSA